jgi:hypothetical protein
MFLSQIMKLRNIRPICESRPNQHVFSFFPALLHLGSLLPMHRPPRLLAPHTPTTPAMPRPTRLRLTSAVRRSATPPRPAPLGPSRWRPVPASSCSSSESRAPLCIKFFSLIKINKFMCHAKNRSIVLFIDISNNSSSISLVPKAML